MADFWNTLTAAFSDQPAKDAAAAREAALNNAYSQYADLAGQGRNVITQNYTSALQPWMNLQGTTAGGVNSYLDATGANGPEGLARARANFNAMVQPDLQMGTDELTRTLAAQGVGAGNVGAEASKYAANELAKRYGSYTAGLAPFLGTAERAAGGIGGIYTGLGQQLGQSFQNQGGQAYQTQTGIGQAQSDADLAQYNASRNLWGAIGSVANLGASALGGAGGIGRLTSGLGSLFNNTLGNSNIGNPNRPGALY